MNLNQMMEESINSNKALHIKNFIDIKSTWNDIFEILTYAHNLDKTDNSQFQRIQKPEEHHLHIMQLCNSADKFNYLEDNYEDVKNIMGIFRNTISGSGFGSLKCLINFLKNGYLGNAHCDKHNVVAVQAINSVKYNIYYGVKSEPEVTINTNGLEYVSYVVEPGDLFYIPPLLVHQVDAIEPRATFIFDFFRMN